MAPVIKRKWWIVGVATLVIVIVGTAVFNVTPTTSKATSNPNILTETFYEFADGNTVCNRVFYFELDGFLTHRQCDQLRAAALDNNMHDSQVGESHSALDVNVRKSTQTWFKHHENDVAKFIGDKVYELINTAPLMACFKGVKQDADFEDVQVVRYDTNGKYDPHFDATECGDDIGVRCVSNQRIATVLIYLNDDFLGGETRFPNLNISVKPAKGKAVFFWVSDQSSRLVYNETLHGGDPVTHGEKWIATQWIRSP